MGELLVYLEQLLGRQAELGQYLGDLSGLIGESVGDCCHHGSAFPTATL